MIPSHKFVRVRSVCPSVRPCPIPQFSILLVYRSTQCIRARDGQTEPTFRMIRSVRVIRSVRMIRSFKFRRAQIALLPLVSITLLLHGPNKDDKRVPHTKHRAD